MRLEPRRRRKEANWVKKKKKKTLLDFNFLFLFFVHNLSLGRNEQQIDRETKIFVSKSDKK